MRMVRWVIVSLTAICSFTSRESALGADDFVAIQAIRGNQNHLFIPVSVNGQKQNWWLVDTGSPLSIIRPREATRAGITIPITLATSGKGRHPVVVATDLVSEGMHFGPKQLAVIEPNDFDLEWTHQSTGSFHKTGLIGLDLLTKFGAVINSRNQQLFFSKTPGRLPVTREKYEQMGFTYIPLEIMQPNHVGVLGTIDGIDYTFMIDTGSPFTTIMDSIAEKENLPRYATNMTLRGYFEDLRNPRIRAASLPRFKIGSQDLSDEFVTFANLNVPTNNLKHPFGGIIGADVLFYRSAILDLGNGALYLAPDFRKKK
jgi:predicted aspartyl protease